jgi:hypothetical protein
MNRPSFAYVVWCLAGIALFVWAAKALFAWVDSHLSATWPFYVAWFAFFIGSAALIDWRRSRAALRSEPPSRHSPD